jgi:hypothetical protein
MFNLRTYLMDIGKICYWECILLVADEFHFGSVSVKLSLTCLELYQIS